MFIVSKALLISSAPMIVRAGGAIVRENIIRTCVCVKREREGLCVYDNISHIQRRRKRGGEEGRRPPQYEKWGGESMFSPPQ